MGVSRRKVVSGMVGGAAIGVLAPRAVAVCAQGTPVASPVPCVVTQPNGVQPPPEAHVFGRGAGDFGNEALWTSLWMWGEGEIQVDLGHVRQDGALGLMKWAWYRFVPGVLTVEGRRLDAPATPMEADVPEGYGDRGFLPTGLLFPTEGCWEITGRVGEASLTFVTRVVKVDCHLPWCDDATPEVGP